MLKNSLTYKSTGGVFYDSLDLIQNPIGCFYLSKTNQVIIGLSTAYWGEDSSFGATYNTKDYLISSFGSFHIDYSKSGDDTDNFEDVPDEVLDSRNQNLKFTVGAGFVSRKKFSFIGLPFGFNYILQVDSKINENAYERNDYTYPK